MDPPAVQLTPDEEAKPASTENAEEKNGQPSQKSDSQNDRQAQSQDPGESPQKQTDSSSEDLNSIDIGELTAKIMEMLNKEDDDNNMNQTGLLKKNVELQEFLVKLIELLRDKTNVCANLDRQNAALTNQAKSLRDVINITKDLLNIRNMEVEHLHADMASMEKCIKEERDRHNTAVQRLTEAMTLNDKLKTEYLNQMELFGKLRDKYNEKVALLMSENKKLKEHLKATQSVNDHIVPASQEIIESNVVGAEEPK